MSSISNRLFRASEALCAYLKAHAPYDTGNLVDNGIAVIGDEPGVYGVVIGGENAPYAKYTNDPWDPPIDLELNRKGKKRTERQKQKLKSLASGGDNPNKGWIERGVNEFIPMLKDIMSGTMTTDDVDAFINSQKEVLQTKRNAMVDKKIKEMEAI